MHDLSLILYSCFLECILSCVCAYSTGIMNHAIHTVCPGALSVMLHLWGKSVVCIGWGNTDMHQTTGNKNTHFDFATIIVSLNFVCIRLYSLNSVFSLTALKLNYVTEKFFFYPNQMFRDRLCNVCLSVCWSVDHNFWSISGRYCVHIWFGHPLGKALEMIQALIILSPLPWHCYPGWPSWGHGILYVAGQQS